MSTILVVDDEESIRRLLCLILTADGNDCIMAANAVEARNRLKEQKFELILCDINMPGESGIDLARYVISEYPDTAAIMVTAMDDPAIAERVIKIGAYDYIVKPAGRNTVLISVTNALRRRKLEISNRSYQERLEQMVSERTDALKNSIRQLRSSLDGVIDTLALTVGTRDPYTAGHQMRVADLVAAISDELGFSEDRKIGVRMAAVIHDLGKIAVPAEILNKPGRLSNNEFNLIKEHPQVGFNILKNINFPWPIAQIVLQHHERMDGSGYPRGLSGKEILFEARILAVADVVETMASHRPYRAALGIDKALEEISKNKGIYYDQKISDICIKLFTEKKFKFKKSQFQNDKISQLIIEFGLLCHLQCKLFQANKV